jgi:branched-chain amino acid transport system ATP-binding protein
MPISSAEDAAPASARLLVAGLTAGYGTAAILHDVSLTLTSGQVLAVIGPNGAGKSTLLRALTGSATVMAGTVTLDDEDITHWSGERRNRKGLGYVPQLRDVFDTLSVDDNLAMGAYRVPKHEIPGRMDEVYTALPILVPLRQRLASKLSGGERKLLGIGRALMAHPAVLLLDEPTAGLSPELSRTILTQHVRRLADGGAAILLVEQKALQALEVADLAHVLVSGSTRLAGRSAELLARPDIREVFLGAVPDAEKRDGVTPQS